MESRHYAGRWGQAIANTPHPTALRCVGLRGITLYPCPESLLPPYQCQTFYRIVQSAELAVGAEWLPNKK